MAIPNGYNPIVRGKVTALGFDAIHGKGVSITVVDITGSTPVSLFGSTNGFNGVITGLLLMTKGATAATVTVTNEGTVATLTGASTAGGVVGHSAALGYATLIKKGTPVVSSNNTADTSKLWIAYKVS
jgi:hypothetical protein